jgi:hypothetical protein
MYIASGWPSNFDSVAFQSSYDQFEEDKRVRYQAEEPLRLLRTLEKWIDVPKKNIAWLEHELSTLDPNSEDKDVIRRIAEHKANLERIRLELASEDTERQEKELVAAKAAAAQVPEDIRIAWEARERKHGW